MEAPHLRPFLRFRFMATEKPSQLSFEQGLEKLESLVSALEQGNISLDEMIKKYEEGSSLIANCETQLKAAELKVLELKKKDNNKSSSISLDPFNPPPCNS